MARAAVGDGRTARVTGHGPAARAAGRRRAARAADRGAADVGERRGRPDRHRAAAVFRAKETWREHRCTSGY